MSTYDEWKSTEPSDPYDEEREIERRDDEASEDEPAGEGALHADYSDAERKARREDGPEHDFWAGLNDEDSNINIVTGEVEE